MKTWVHCFKVTPNGIEYTIRKDGRGIARKRPAPLAIQWLEEYADHLSDDPENDRYDNQDTNDLPGGDGVARPWDMASGASKTAFHRA